MLSHIVLVGATAYLIAAVVAFIALRRRPDLSRRIWTADVVLSVVLVAVALADRNWLLVALWVLNTVLAVVNLRLARQRQEMDKTWAGAFRN